MTWILWGCLPPCWGCSHPTASELGSGGGADSLAIPQCSGGVPAHPDTWQHPCNVEALSIWKRHSASWRGKKPDWTSTSIPDCMHKYWIVPLPHLLSAVLAMSLWVIKAPSTEKSYCSISVNGRDIVHLLLTNGNYRKGVSNARFEMPDTRNSWPDWCGKRQQIWDSRNLVVIFMEDLQVSSWFWCLHFKGFSF